MNLMNVAWKVYFSLPPAVRTSLRYILKRDTGHGVSKFNKVIAQRDAHGKCRIDRTAEMFCQGLTSAGISGIESKSCLEIGTGYVGSVATVMWLLGAEEVTSIDLNPLLVVDALKEAVRSAKKEDLIDLLRGYVGSKQSLVRRVEEVYRWANVENDDLPDFFRYVSPFDLLVETLNQEFDFMFSVSTLEHIPKSAVDRFVEGTASLLRNGGIELHSIDLADHYDSKHDPLGFLALAGDEYSDDSDADSRGNRIRASEWLRIFTNAGLRTDIVQSSRAATHLLPSALASPFDKMEVEDLLFTSILLRSQRVLLA